MFFLKEKMMTTMRDALIASGINPTQAQVREQRETEALNYLKQEIAQLKADSSERQCMKILNELNSVSSPKKFRALSKKLLLIKPDHIRKVTEIAHARGIHKQSKGGKALIAQLLQARNLLESKNLSNTEKVLMIDNTISKH